MDGCVMNHAEGHTGGLARDFSACFMILDYQVQTNCDQMPTIG